MSKQLSKKRALIVDDSKSARVVLGRMLQKYDIEVDTAESAETAIEFLKAQRPDVIFMDHLMPGMDGFQAVQAIKNNPDTATIPIMMYTSQQGELYVGQARALGAVGVLPKLVKPADVSRVLYQLHLLPDRRESASEPGFERANPLEEKPAADAALKGGVELIPTDWQPQLQSTLREHDADLRRFFGATLDSFLDRASGRLAEEMKVAVNETIASQAALAPRPSYLPVAAAVLLALLPAVALGVFYLRALDDNRVLAAAVTSLEQTSKQMTASVERLTGQVTELTNHAAAPDTVTASNGAIPEGGIPVDTPLIETVPYGEVPLAMGRVETLREVLARLRSQSFHGKLRVEAFRGQFCLSGSAKEGYSLAPANLPAGECDLIGNPHADALSAPQRESLAFANLASSSKQLGEGLTVDVVRDGQRVAVPYPPPTENVTAGEWNAIAARNNRVEFKAIPATAPGAPAS